MNSQHWMLASATLLVEARPGPALAQSAPITFQGDLVARQEWTENLFTAPCAECHTVGPDQRGRLRGEYTYATVDRDLALAAYAGDDFFWGTGWDGHRLDLGFARTPNASFHLVAQWQRFKETADPVERAWIRRVRLEARRRF